MELEPIGLELCRIKIRTQFCLNFKIQLQFLPLTNSSKTQLQQNRNKFDPI